VHRFVARERYAKEEPTTDERVERVARAICNAEGKNPDEMVPRGHMENIHVRRGGARREATAPAWKSYEQEARRFLAAFDAARRTIY
jgi:hypothetical protein